MRTSCWILCLSLGLWANNPCSGANWYGGTFAELPSQTRGALSFRFNGRELKADPAHARAYSVVNTRLGYLSAANADNMILNVQATGLNKKGKVQLLPARGDQCNVTIDHTDFSIRNQGDFFIITITEVIQQGQMLLLSGIFEAKLHDKKGKEALITNGHFQTEYL